MKKSATIAISVFSFLLTIIPEQQFLRIKLFKSISDERNIIINRVLFLFVLMIVTAIIYKIVVSIKWWRTIKGRNYTIVVKYQDIFEAKNCKKVIPFDECYTVEIGNAPGEIKLGSICGQYLQKYPITNMQSLLDGIQLKSKGKSMYQNKEKYESGRLIPVNEFLLLSFAKLDKDGLGRMTREELNECLSVLWTEIDKYYGQQDVCIPILGSGITRMDDTSLMQQELLEIIIASYKLSAAKIKKPSKLYIVCKRTDDFSLNRIGNYI